MVTSDHTRVAEIILRTQTQLSLKCLAAKAVQKYNIQYIGQVPHSLESFIDLHGPGEVPPGDEA
ncbi:Protein fem-1 B [Homalodisca vitripennis]|nr:Protein fem-1 B [Homalodisca vitripennis]